MQIACTSQSHPHVLRTRLYTHPWVLYHVARRALRLPPTTSTVHTNTHAHLCQGGGVCHGEGHVDQPRQGLGQQRLAAAGWAQ